MRAVTSQPLPSTQCDIETVDVGVQDVTVRYMLPTDADFIARCSVYAFRGKLGYIVGEHKLENLIEAQAHQVSLLTPVGHRRILVAEYNGKPAGAAAVHFRNEEPDPSDTCALCRHIGCWSTFRKMRLVLLDATFGDVKEGHCYLDYICVEEDFRGKGIGKALLTACDQRAREEGSHTIYLYCLVGNQAKNLYDRHGYKELRIQDDGCLMEKFMGVRRFYEMAKPL